MQATQTVKYIEKHEVFDEIQETILLDVRTWKERLNGHFENDYHLSLQDISMAEMLFDKSVQLVVYCDTEYRAKLACRLLAKLGFKCKTLAGGFRAKNKPHE